VSTVQYVRTEYHCRRERQYMDNSDISLGTVTDIPKTYNYKEINYR